MDIDDKLSAAGINVKLSRHVLELINQQPEVSDEAETVKLPQLEKNPAFVDFAGGAPIFFDAEAAQRNVARFPAAAACLQRLLSAAPIANGRLQLSLGQLNQIGQSLLSEFAFGLFNGGSASSYFDRTRNRKYSAELFQLYQHDFDTWAQHYAELPKGLTPAFATVEDQKPTFLELKIRALLHLSRQAQERGISQAFPRPAGFFQMTGTQTDQAIQEAMRSLGSSPFLAPLLAHWQIDPCQYLYAVQPLIAAITHSQQGQPREFFFDRHGQPLALPGGHGQCFVTLKDVFQKLRQQGYRYVSLGNIDNLGYSPDAGVLALLALKGDHAAFYGSYKTAVDTKGGVILENEAGRFTCRDLGVGFDPKIVAAAEEAGQAVLFNCAVGYFDLDYLLENLDLIINTLPLRVSDQDKDRGMYAQIEQVTWEAIGLIDKVAIVGVAKERRFLAAKLLLENFINSGYQMEQYPPECAEFKRLAQDLSSGLQTILAEDCGLNLHAGVNTA